MAIAGRAAPAELARPATLQDALEQLDELGEEGAVIAGATWIARAHARGERLERGYVSLRDVPGLREIAAGPDETRIGALATHTDLATLDGPLAAIGEAARRSAFPAVRNVATLGGNVAAAGFAEADLVPALLAAEAELEIATLGAVDRHPLADYLADRRSFPGIIVAAHVPAPAGRRSAFERITVRVAGEYPLANIAISVDLAADGATVEAARVAVGVLEPVARRSAAAEAALVGRPIDAAAGRAAGAAAVEELSSRDGIDAPAWYRAAVLPTLAERAAARIAAG